MNFKVGQGIDCHQLIEGIPLIIGGVQIEYSKGSKGHSDGDVLFHALTDAILGANNKGDIGIHFPSSDPKWKNADSSNFLKHSYNLMIDEGYSIGNIDSTIILQEPKLLPYIQQMKSNIANILQLSTTEISIKATTTDHLGFIGKNEGICSLASVMIFKNE